MANTRETMGEQACLDALIADTLTYFEDDGVTQINNLNMHNALTSVVMNQCKSVNSYGFSDCANIETIDIQGTGTILANAFSNDAKLKHLIIRGATMTGLYNINAFSRTPILLGEGGVYIDKDLISTYKVNSNWNNLLLFPLEDYPRTIFETIDDSWAEIITACSNGSYDQKYSIGDVKSMVINGITYYFQLVAKDEDVLASDGATTVPTTWLMYKKMYNNNHRMNPAHDGTQGTGTNGGWEYSEMRAYLENTVLPLFPAELQTGIKEVRKYSDYVVPGESAITHDQVTSDKLWIPSACEMFGKSRYEQTGPSYNSFFSASGRKTRYNQAGTDVSYWLRSASSVSQFKSINGSGSISASTATSASGVVLGFCI